MVKFENKLVAIVNKDLEVGKAMEELVYYGAVLFGLHDHVNALTKKLSLYN